MPAFGVADEDVVLFLARAVLDYVQYLTVNYRLGLEMSGCR